MQEILSSFALTETRLEPFGSGLINRTWKVYGPERNYVLQRINVDVFEHPRDIAHNIRLIADYLQKNCPEYHFVAPLNAASGDDIVYCKKNGWFRLMPFVEDSFTIDVVTTPEQAYEAARQFGKFTRLLSGFDSTQLKITIPHFHDLSLRYQQFISAIVNGNEKRKRESRDLINELLYHKSIVEQYQQLVSNPAFKLRVTHHDTKISNVLFDQNNKGVCVIDLDTIMPGFFVSDVGDMIRTYVSPVSEEESDFEKINLREDFYISIIEGYSDEMKDQLTAIEKKQFVFSGKFMTYMQALRFLTDYLNDDAYYGAKYDGHNLVRAKNQMTLLKRLREIDDN